MDNASRWYFTKENLDNTPSRQSGIDALKENSYRQQAANFIQDMGQRLHVTQLCINTAIVYMHRFYMFHSFSKQHRNQIAVAALFLAAKVEEQPRKLEHTVRVAYKCLNRGKDVELRPEVYLQKSVELVYHENMMLQTLGFDIAIDHPHTYVVKLLQLVKASKELAQTSYFMATNSLHLTTMCLQYRPTVVACVCINIACKWSDWKIEPSTEGKEWYYYVDKAVTPELLEELTKDFILVLEKSPNRLRRRIYPGNNREGQSSQSAEFRAGDDLSTHMENLPYDNCLEPTREQSPPIPSTCPSTSSSSAVVVVVKEEKTEKQPESSSLSSVPDAAHNALPSVPQLPPTKPKMDPQHSISLAVYREKKEKERHTDQKPPVPAPVELQAPLIPRNPPVHNKHVIPNKQEKVPPKPDALFSELVPQKMQPVQKSNSHQSSANAETTSSDKVNHQIKKVPAVVLPSPHAPPASHAPPPTPQPPKSALPKGNAELMKALSDNSKANDPFVLLTRLDQATVAQKGGDTKFLLPAQSVKVNVKSLPLDAKLPGEVRAVPPSPTVPANACDTVKNVLRSSDAHLMPTRPKHSKQKAPSLQNSHTDAQLLSQGITPNQGPAWDVGQANGSSVPDAPVANSRMPVHIPPVVDHRVGEKTADAHPKNEKRERHKHKHSFHSSKEKGSNHVLEGPPEKALKITIPMDKILLRGNQKANASHGHESPRKSLKIKLPVPKESSVPKLSMQSPLKLVITKDKNAGSYSATHKAEKYSRKRDRSPSSKDHNSRSVKQHKADHSQINRIPAKAERQNNVAWNADGSYNQNSSTQQPYVMQTVYYQQPYYNYSMPTTTMQYGHMQPPPPPPLPPAVPSSNAVPPPLPRDPPPPLPPQPPLPSE